MPHKDSKVPAILRLWQRGVPKREIAEQVGCTVQNVCNAVRKHGYGWAGYVAPIPERLQAWISREAKRAGVASHVMARALLIDAIEDAIEEKANDRSKDDARRT